MDIKKLILCCFYTFNLSACATNKAISTFDLSAYNFLDLKAKYHCKAKQILISEPSSTKFYDSENIIVKDAVNSLAYLGGSQWADRLPNLVQTRLIEAFDNSHFFKAIARPGERMAYDYELITNIRSFNIYIIDEYTAKVNITLDAKLLQPRTGRVRASKIFTSSSDVYIPGKLITKIPPYTYVGQFNEAFQELTKNLILWTRKYS